MFVLGLTIKMEKTIMFSKGDQKINKYIFMQKTQTNIQNTKTQTQKHKQTSIT